MISCTEFIPAYSELFKFLEARGGRRAVEAFWEYLSDGFLGNLRERRRASTGCAAAGSTGRDALSEEAADFTMELDEEAGRFRIVMHHCPSMGRLLELDHVEPYHDYCRHCDVLYRRVLEPLGYRYTIDLSQCHEAPVHADGRRSQRPEGDMQADDSRTVGRDKPAVSWMGRRSRHGISSTAARNWPARLNAAHDKDFAP